MYTEEKKKKAKVDIVVVTGYYCWFGVAWSSDTILGASPSSHSFLSLTMWDLPWMWSSSSRGVEKLSPVASHNTHTRVSGISDLQGDTQGGKEHGATNNHVGFVGVNIILQKRVGVRGAE